ncbi:hypothetical protein D9619_003845 [Psilocybe cf. subviscida]|uniref:Uncharacterized protein n=1 Tax=Psilocybe cf. subviscida TaxID=2480587 RepID=A0A8H5AYK6_9AGAR|nr:hypothetical protein D9619_003845 [Psilocybe cf. subviscida]
MLEMPGEVDDLHVVFSVLSPLVKLRYASGVEFYGFCGLPGVMQWQRFNKYATIIRKLVYAPNSPRLPLKLLSQKAMVQISHTRTRLEVFPNLNTLVWRPHSSAADAELGSPTLNDGLLFMHSAVTDFTFSHLNGHVEPDANHFLRDIQLHMPNLTQLSRHTSQPVALLESGLCSLVKHLHAVTIMPLPAYYLTSRVAEALSVLPSLRVMVVGHGKPEDVYPEHPSLAFRPVLPPNSFKAMRNLSVKMHAADATKVLLTMTFPSDLRLFHVVFVTAVIPFDSQKLLEVSHKSIKPSAICH